MPSYKVLKAAVAGLSRAYLSYYGPYSLAPKRAEPMKFSMVRELYAIPSAESSATQVGSIRWCDSDHNVFMFRRLICVMMVTAFRLVSPIRPARSTVLSAWSLRTTRTTLSTPRPRCVISSFAWVGPSLAAARPPYSLTLRVNPTPTTFFMLFSEPHSPTFTGRRSPSSIRSTPFDRGSRQRSMPPAWRMG